jgi:acyl-CoA thioester hydrolase
MSEPKPIHADTELVIPFHDVDLLRVAWHGHYCKYLELGRCALLEKIGYDYLTMRETGHVWPIVDLQLRYLKPARFMQTIRIHAELVEWEYRMKIKYRIEDAHSRQVLAKAQTVQVAVNAESGDMLFASPPVLLEKLESYRSGSNP